MSKISIKLEDKFSGKASIHLIRYPESYPLLIQSVRDTFKNKLPSNFSLSYKDVDNEIINLNNEDDFDAAIAFHQEEKMKSLKIFVTKREEEENSEANSEENYQKQSQIVEIKDQVNTSHIVQTELIEQSKDQENLQKSILPEEQKNDEDGLEKETTIQIIKKEEENENNTKVEILFENMIVEKPKPAILFEEIPPPVEEKNEFPAISEEKKEVEEENRPFLPPAPLEASNKKQEEASNSEIFANKQIFEKEMKEKGEEVQPSFKEAENAHLNKLFQEFICTMIESPVSFSYPCQKCLKKKNGTFNFMNIFCGVCQNKGQINVTNNDPKVQLLNNVLNAKLSYALTQISHNPKPIFEDDIFEQELFKARVHQSPPDLILTFAQLRITPRLILPIEIENIGLNSWPSQVFLICTEGYLKNTLKEVTSLAPAQKKAEKIEIKSPSNSKANKLVWKLGYIKEEIIKYFGPNIVHRILLDEEEEDWNKEKDEKKNTKEKEKEGKLSKEEERKNEELRKKAKQLVPFCGSDVEKIEKFIIKYWLNEKSIEVIAEEIFERGIDN